MNPSRAVDGRPRRGDRSERHFGEEQDFSALLHDRVVLLHHFDVERGDRLRRTRFAVAQLGERVVHEDCVADEDRADKPPVGDAEKRHRGLAQLPGPRPHQAMRIGEPQHAVRYAPTELAALGVNIAGVELRVIAGQTGEADHIRIRDGAPRTAEPHPDEQILVSVAQARRFRHGLAVSHAALVCDIYPGTGRRDPSWKAIPTCLLSQ